MILHAIFATKQGDTSLRIFTPDTDVLVLAVNYFSRFPINTCVNLLGMHSREIPLHKLFNSLGRNHALALLVMHALSGVNVTGSFAGKAKTMFWNRFLEADSDVLEALTAMGKEKLGDEIFQYIETYVCSIYSTPLSASAHLATLHELRWWLFSKKQAEGTSMPQTQAALHPAIRRAHYQAMEWQRADVAHPLLPLPSDFDWTLENGSYKPILCDLPCAPPELLEIVRCSCRRSRCAPPCKCLANLTGCIEMCACRGDSDNCDNTGETDDNELVTDDEMS